MTSAVVYDYDDSFGANFVNTKSVPQLQNYPTLGSEGKAVCVRVCLTEREREREKSNQTDVYATQLPNQIYLSSLVPVCCLFIEKNSETVLRF